MAFQVRIPNLGESVTEGTIVRWAKQDGDTVKPDDVLLELETDKANMEIPSDQSGVLKIVKPAGTTVQVGEVVAEIDSAGAPRAAAPAQARTVTSASASTSASSAPAAAKSAPTPTATGAPPPPGPAARHLVAEHGLDASAISGTGKHAQVTKGDVLAQLESAKTPPATAPAQAAPAPMPAAKSAPALAPVARPATPAGTRAERAVPMTRIRKRIAERLVEAQRTAAILTTFNEIDMSAVMDLRARHKERFEKKHGIGLGFMSLFGLACIAALKELPAVNAEIRGDNVVYKDFVHLGIAVGTERGLVVPVVRDADILSVADLEREIARLAALARDGKLLPDDLMGG